MLLFLFIGVSEPSGTRRELPRIVLDTFHIVLNASQYYSNYYYLATNLLTPDIVDRAIGRDHEVPGYLK